MGPTQVISRILLGYFCVTLILLWCFFMVSFKLLYVYYIVTLWILWSLCSAFFMLPKQLLHYYFGDILQLFYCYFEVTLGYFRLSFVLIWVKFCVTSVYFFFALFEYLYWLPSQLSTTSVLVFRSNGMWKTTCWLACQAGKSSHKILI